MCWLKNDKSGFLLVESMISLFLVAGFIVLFVAMIRLQTLNYKKQRVQLNQMEDLYIRVVESNGRSGRGINYQEKTLQVYPTQEETGYVIHLEGVQSP